MVANDLVEISLRDGEEEVNLRRPHVVTGPTIPVHLPYGHLPMAHSSIPPAQSTMSTETPVAPKVEETFLEIISPMVGTFYSSADPESPAFVQVGGNIQIGSVVCIVEAMKVFNEIKSEIAGVVERVLVKNAQPVEYGQPLFLVRPHA